MAIIVACSSVADAVGAGSSDQSSSRKAVPHRPQFARGLDPHVDSFVLSQREEQRKKELSYKVSETVDILPVRLRARARLLLPMLRVQSSITWFVGGVSKSDNRKEVAA